MAVDRAHYKVGAIHEATSQNQTAHRMARRITGNDSSAPTFTNCPASPAEECSSPNSVDHNGHAVEVDSTESVAHRSLRKRPVSAAGIISNIVKQTMSHNKMIQMDEMWMSREQERGCSVGVNPRTLTGRSNSSSENDMHSPVRTVKRRRGLDEENSWEHFRASEAVQKAKKQVASYKDLGSAVWRPDKFYEDVASKPKPYMTMEDILSCKKSEGERKERKEKKKKKKKRKR